MRQVPVLWLLWLATAAVAGRVLFRIVFNFDDGYSPAFVLPKLFVNFGFGSEVQLFGPVSWHALAVATSDGLKLAALVVGFALVMNLINVRKLIGRAPKFLQGTALPIGSAITFVPLLSETISRINSSSKLLRTRTGSLITPVLESAVERSIALAQSMELRGYGGGSMQSDAMIQMLDFSLQMAGRKILDSIDFAPAEGKLILLAGKTGSGKTLLLKSICGLAPAYTGGQVTGDAAGGRAVYLNQQPELGFVAEQVDDEIAFALQQRRLSRAQVTTEVERLATALGVDHLLNRRVSEISAGQQQRVAIAAALATGYRTILLDEPSSALDADGIGALQTLLGELKSFGVTVVIAEHHLDRFADQADEFFILEAAKLRRASDSEIRALSSRRLKPVALTREITVVVGPNGSGKSTMLRELQKSNDRAALVPQIPSDLLLTSTVAEALVEPQSRELFEDLVGVFDDQLHPHDLSAGMQLALAIAIQCGSASGLVLLDEPTRGLDFEAKQKLLGIIQRLDSLGNRVVVATNDEEFIEVLGGVRIQAARGAVLT